MGVKLLEFNIIEFLAKKLGVAKDDPEFVKMLHEFVDRFRLKSSEEESAE